MHSISTSLGFASLYTEGWALVANPITILLIFAAVLVGMAVGAIPGLTANMAVAVLVPLTFALPTADAFAVLAGVWLGALYGGTLPAVLLNIPGTPADIMSTLDGYPMSRRGNGGRAIGIGILCSFLGGVFSVLVLGTAGPSLAALARNFGSAEFFAVTVLGLSVIAFVSGKSMVKGLIAALIGLLLGTVGRDLLSGEARLTFNQNELLNGVDFIAIVVGIFGLAEVLERVYNRAHREKEKPQPVIAIWSAVKDIRPLKWVIARSSVIGTLIGVIPGAGATIASVVAYGTQKQVSKDPSKMGTGAKDGLAASESANNAVTGGALLTMLSLGIPADALTAILLGGLIVQGVQPGPLLFENDIELVSAIFICLLLANVCLLLIGMFGARYFAKVLYVPRTLLYPLIVVACITGSYALRGSFFDVGVTLLAALIGFAFSRAGIPKSPLVLALILGPILETNLRRMLSLNDDSPVSAALTLVTSPVALPVLIVTAILFALPVVRSVRNRRATGRPA